MTFCCISSCFIINTNTHCFYSFLLNETIGYSFTYNNTTLILFNYLNNSKSIIILINKLRYIKYFNNNSFLLFTAINNLDVLIKPPILMVITAERAVFDPRRPSLPTSDNASEPSFIYM